MIKNLLGSIEKNKIIIFCNKLLSNNFTAHDIIESINIMAQVTSKILPNPKPGTLYVSSTMSILIDDILEMYSLSNREKDESILELIEKNKVELQSLAFKIISQIESDLQDAKNNGYCPELIKEA